MKRRILSVVLASSMTLGAVGLVAAADEEGAITNKPYINGYEDKTFKPKNNVKRSEISKMMATIRGLSSSNANFGDVPVDHWAKGYIGAVQNAGIVQGYQGNFKPEAGLTRAELATIVSRVIKLDSKEREKVGGVNFPDISGHWGETAIREIADLGIIKGYEDGTFRPEGTVTREEAVTMVNGMLDRKLDPEILAKVKNLFTDVYSSDWSAKDIVAASGVYRYVIEADGRERVLFDTEIPSVEGDFKVESASAVNLNQIEVLFDTEVDKDSAEVKSNYRLNGNPLTENDVVTLLSDGKTLLINLDTPMKEESEVEFAVIGQSFYNETHSGVVSAYMETLTFGDTDIPTIKSVTALGNRRVIIEFSEAMKINRIPTTFFRIDDEFAVNMGLAKIEVLDATTNNKYSSRIELEFNKDIPEGRYELSMVGGSAVNLVDAAGNIFEEDSAELSISSEKLAPTIQEIRASDNGIVEVEFSREMSAKTALDKNNYSIKGTRINDIEFKNSTDGRVVVLKLASLTEGAKTIEFKKELTDRYGNAIASTNLEKTMNVKLDSIAPEVLGIANIGDDTIRVIFNEPVNDSTARRIANYEITDSSDVKLDIRSITAVGKNSMMYEIKFAKKLEDGAYVMKIANVRDIAKAKNTIKDKILSFQYSDLMTPKVIDNGVLKRSDREIEIEFNKKMDPSTINAIENYRYRDGNKQESGLPVGTVLTVIKDGKGVKLTFPVEYTVYTKDKIASAPTTDRSITAVGIKSIFDLAGNEVADGLYEIQDPSLVYGSKYVEDSLELKDAGAEEKVLATFKLSEIVYGSSVTGSALYPEEFKINGLIPDSAMRIKDVGENPGNLVQLTFTSPEKVKELRSAGKNATIALNTESTNKNTTIEKHRIEPFADKKVSKEAIEPRLVGTAEVEVTALKRVILEFTEALSDAAITDPGKYFEVYHIEDGKEVKNNITGAEVIKVAGVAGNKLALITNENVPSKSKIRIKNTLGSGVGKDAAVKDPSGNAYNPVIPTGKDVLEVDIEVASPLAGIVFTLSPKGANEGGTLLEIARGSNDADLEYRVERGGVEIEPWTSIGSTATTKAIDYVYQNDKIEIRAKENTEFTKTITIDNINSIKLVDVTKLYEIATIKGNVLEVRVKEGADKKLMGGKLEYNLFRDDSFNTEWKEFGDATATEGTITKTIPIEEFKTHTIARINIRINEESRPVKDDDYNGKDSYVNIMYTENEPVAGEVVTVKVDGKDKTGLEITGLPKHVKVEISEDGVSGFVLDLNANKSEVYLVDRTILESELISLGVLDNVGDLDSATSAGKKFHLRLKDDYYNTYSKVFEITIP